MVFQDRSQFGKKGFLNFFLRFDKFLIERRLIIDIVAMLSTKIFLKLKVKIFLGQSYIQFLASWVDFLPIVHIYISFFLLTSFQQNYVLQEFENI